MTLEELKTKINGAIDTVQMPNDIYGKLKTTIDEAFDQYEKEEKVALQEN